MKPLCIDLFAGLGGFSEGFLAEGYDCIGFDIERHEYCVPESFPEGDGAKGTKPVAKRGWTQGCAVSLGMEGARSLPRTRVVKYPAQLVLQDVLTLDGAQFRNAACIVASPPCQEFSFMAMPWKRAKKIAAALRGQGDFPSGYRGSKTVKELTALFDACFRLQREASEAAGHHIPLVVENVKGAQPWVGRAKARYGSFYLWGDVEDVGGRIVASGKPVFGAETVRACRAHKTVGHVNKRDGYDHTRHLTNQRESDAIKNSGGSWFAIGSPGQKELSRNPVHDGIKQHGSGAAWLDKALDERRRQATATKNRNDQFGSGENCSLQRRASSRSSARKAASAQIAKIPEALARHIARCYKP